MMKLRRGFALFLIATLVLVLAACEKKTPTGREVAEINFESYPIQSDATLTYWVELNALMAQTAQNLSDSPFGKALSEKTGVNIRYIHPPQGQVNEQFSILMASNELPDIIEHNWYNFSGGPRKAIDEQVIIPINDIMDKYSPNFNKYLNENPEIDKMLKTDDGTYYAFPYIRGDEILLTSKGLMIREDWLNDLNLAVPETISEWHNVLTQFKEKKGATAPLSLLGLGTYNAGAFSGAYGVSDDFFIDNGKVVYGPADYRYKDYLTTFAQWYKEGLLDSNIANVDSALLSANILNNSTGATLSFAGSGLGTYINTLKEKDAKASLVPAPYPSLNKGELPARGHRELPYVGGSSAAITTSCKNVELAARFLDYGYSEEGGMLFNFGIEGESYELVDGAAKYTDLIMKNPDGLTISQAMIRYIKASSGGVFVQRKEYIEQYYALPQQKAALNIWAKHDEASHLLPRITFTSEESAEIANIMSNVGTFVNERTYQYVMGKEDLSTFEGYLDTLKNYGIDRAIEIYATALTRYNNR